MTTLGSVIPKRVLISSNFIQNYKLHNHGKIIQSYDVAIIGGGIVGAASARELLIRHPQLRIAILEKENRWAAHQTGNNSGVVHAGIYYKPNSLKAKLCVEGMKLAYEYFDKSGIKYSKCGKLIVATEKKEIPRLLDLYDRGQQNGVADLQLLESSMIPEYAPHCVGVQAIWSPHTGIVNWGDVARSYIKDFHNSGGKCFLNFEVNEFREATDNVEYPVLISSGQSSIQAKYVLTCCGLQSDKIAVLTGSSEDPKIIPFRGEYLLLHPGRCHLVKTNIYPVPDPRFPFLGVHLTPRIDGSVILGPNAILAFSREGYKWSDVNFNDMREIVGFNGFRKMAMQYMGFGLTEMLRSAIIPLQVAQIRKYLPEIMEIDVVRGPAGVRAQAMAAEGNLVDDFVFDLNEKSSLRIGGRILHCRNVPSPGATSSLTIAKMIADKMKKEFNL